jgi:3-deoxy-D-manno-octulosonic-acid transferase
MAVLPALWSAAATAAAPLLPVWLRARAARGKELPRRLDERRGVETTPRPPGRLVWVHAASVGETVSVLPVVTALANLAPDVTVLMTTGTVTSARLLATRLPALGLERRVVHRFVPLDVPAWAARFLDHWRPDAAAFVESELWPNLLAALRRRRVPAMLVNARLSPRSAARWARAPATARTILSSFARVQARAESDAARLRALGAHGVTAPGDLKFSAEPLPVDNAELARLRARLGGRPVWLAASTHPGEEAIAAAVHRRLAPAHPGLLTIVAPRHPDRGARIAHELGEPPRRAAGADPPAGEGLWIADTLGELGLLYRLAPVVLVGRSLLPPGGGQNPVEPARLGCAVAVGPHAGNFEDALALLGPAVARVADEPALAEWAGAMLADPAARAAAGAAARSAVARHDDLPLLTARTLLDLMAGAARPGLE